jgi:hypothetical protein
LCGVKHVDMVVQWFGVVKNVDMVVRWFGGVKRGYAD